MAVTKLLNIKSSSHGAGRHLYNAIAYIMNPKKTDDGVLVGGNAGSTKEEVYDTMLTTKKDWEKLEGRQGYHFVLSWKPGETDTETAYQMLQEFCAEYLGDNYDYVFAIHGDQEHVHGHLIFNSVNRINGYKYRYEKGDWETKIQPVTDRICERHGLPKLEYDKENRLGISYAEWNAEKKGKFSWKKIIQADIDFAVSQSDSYPAFLECMKKLGYHIKTVHTRSDGEVLSLRAPGQNRAWRTKTSILGEAYTISGIQNRIGKEVKEYGVPKPPKLRSFRMPPERMRPSCSGYQMRRVREMYRTKHRFSIRNPYAVHPGKVRRNLLEIDRLAEDCRYLFRNRIHSEAELLEREGQLQERERFWRNRQSSLRALEREETYQQYAALRQELQELPESEDRFEELQDAMEALEEKLPFSADQCWKEQRETAERLAALRRERRVIRHIRASEQEPTVLPSAVQRRLSPQSPVPSKKKIQKR